MLDVKCGDGAFMKTAGQARALAASMVAIGNHAGMRTEAFITDMSVPLGRSVGNALELIEAIDTLKGNGAADLRGVVLRLAARMVALGGVETDAGAAAARVEAALASGRALETFVRMVERQGGDPHAVEDSGRLPAAPGREYCRAPRPGFVTAMRAEAIGMAAHRLGAGRERVTDPVDHGVGVVMLVKLGDEVREGDPLLVLHHRDGRGLAPALALCGHAVAIDDEPPPVRVAVLDEVR